MFCVGRKYMFFNLILFMEFAGESCNLLRALDLVLRVFGTSGLTYLHVVVKKCPVFYLFN